VHANAPLAAPDKSAVAKPSPGSLSSPKRSPSKKLEQLARHFRSSASTEKNGGHGGGPVSPSGASGGRNRWREEIGRSFRRHG
jgi:hypothetical protein